MDSLRHLTSENIGEIVLDGFLKFLIVTVVFGSLYWLIRTRIEGRKKAERERWIGERRAKRLAGGDGAPHSADPTEARVEMDQPADR